MSIYPLEKDIVGTYYYEKHENEMKLKGKAGEKILNRYFTQSHDKGYNSLALMNYIKEILAI
ncbi:hypothetical protein D2A34_13570 [Clostridium chromiireducens]|uniref:Uncharacterized protein n=1 Tax=Clostridium chromiireducens TaxID=225345 RepID=A0A399ITN0_9CLOT|nr:hypothetical protein [Clostridium chromiireducens]RII34186.1 hypothetical protein D2A34_13570 [Clostridium chromiireducens]